MQWLTAGKGVVHCEMFPLVHTDRSNPVELFQIWINLPARSKTVAPHFTMFWREDIARVRRQDAQGKATEVACVAGALGDARGLPPPPDSWAAQSDSDLAIWTIKMESNARWTLPAATGKGTRRMLANKGVLPSMPTGTWRADSPHASPLRGSLPHYRRGRCAPGAKSAWGRPGADLQAPHAPQHCRSLPHHVPILPPSFLVITMVAERGRLPAP